MEMRKTAKYSLITAVGGIAWFIVLAVAVSVVLWKKGGVLTVDIQKQTFAFQSYQDLFHQLLNGKQCDAYFGNSILSVCNQQFVLGPKRSLIQWSDSGALKAHHLVSASDWNTVRELVEDSYCTKFGQIEDIGSQCEQRYTVWPVSVSFAWGAPSEKQVLFESGGKLTYEYAIHQRCTLIIRGSTQQLEFGGVFNLDDTSRKLGRQRVIQINSQTFKSMVGSAMPGVVEGKLQCPPVMPGIAGAHPSVFSVATGSE
jgi:hypothetical protein